VQPLPVEFPWQDAEFRQAWQTYKEYLEEQHHIVMESRMEIARLKLIRQFAKNQRAAAIAAIEFYMALGTANVFEINTNDEKQDDNGKKNITVIPIS
jgi:predicted metal-dependent hydrolase